jgi:hypothetical protein
VLVLARALWRICAWGILAMKMLATAMKVLRKIVRDVLEA